MKKIFGLLLIFALVIMSMSGCNQGSGSGAPPETTVAGASGTLAKYSLSIDNAIIAVAATTLSTGKVTAKTPATPTYDSSDGWWSSSNNYSSAGITFSITYYFKMWRSDVGLVDTALKLDGATTSNLSDLWTHTAYSITNSNGTFSMSLGDSKTTPLKFVNYQTAKAIDGPITYTSTYNAKDYTCTLDYDSFLVSTSGYPTGVVTITCTYDGSVAYTAQMTFNGTSSATMTYLTGSTGSYVIDLDSGAAVATSLN